MPYSGPGDKSLPANVKKMPADKKKKWVSIFNNTYNSCINDDNSKSTCEAKAFKAANGSVSQIKERSVGMNKTLLRRVWDGLVTHINQDLTDQTEQIERAMSFSRMREQLWDALDNSEQAANGWVYPIDMFVDDNGGLFSIVTQSGKLYEVPIKVSGEEMTLGDWTQVTQVFEPVEQNRLIIRKQPDGRYRWLGVVATTVINRVGEIDTSELFDSFIVDAEETGDYPAVDFYHMGRTNPKVWDFGMADYLARDGCCYVATGLFDEEHPLAKATIRAYEEDPDVWGFSIEFYAHADAEVLVVDPEIRVPTYKSGKNTRISIVKEEDAASLFTRIGITQEKVRMARELEEKLAELFGDDEEALSSFLENVDNINRTVKDEKLIHRSKKKKSRAAEEDAEDEEEPQDEDDVDETDEEDETEEEEAPVIELDEEAVQQIAEQVFSSEKFALVQQSLDKLQESLDSLVEAGEADKKEIARLQKANGKLEKRLEAVEEDETDKKQKWAEDIPRRRSVRATYQPREAHDTDEEEEESMERIATATLSKLPSY